jgi:dihydroorotate dehydrogenase
LNPEKAHHRALSLFNIGLSLPAGKSIFQSIYDFEDPSLEREVFGLKFKNPVGLAAGFDKDGKYFHQMASLGFGHIEIGTVTPKPQEGNPQPRLFRLPQDGALINRMGFNNDGVDAMVKRLKKGKPSGTIIGGNIGKNKITPNDQAVDDYIICFNKLHDYVDYFVVNVSSPNTPGLRALQDKKPLTHILSRLMEENLKKDHKKPILLKIAPDLTHGQLDDIIEIVKDTAIDGLIATNTTISREGLRTPSEDVKNIGAGGLSGKPVNKKSSQVLKYIHDKSGGTIPMIGVGGIDSGKTAEEKLKNGAVLVQVYTGFIYEGPGLIKRINRHLVSQH